MKTYPTSCFNTPFSNTCGNRVTPYMLKSAYNYPANTAISGDGITVAVVVAHAGQNTAKELSVYSETFDLAKARLEVVQLGKSKVRSNAWERESALDVQLVHAFAPGARILLYVTGSDDLEDIMQGVKIAAQNGADVVNMSFGVSEMQAVAQGVSEQKLREICSSLPHSAIYVASAGDRGGVCSFPASCPCCFGVGGTRFEIPQKMTNKRAEMAWKNGGGGASAVFDAPKFQCNFRPIAFMSSGMRATPDVAFIAESVEGVAVYVSDVYEGVDGWISACGTSVGAPAWSGIAALCLEASGKKLGGHKAFAEFLYNLAGGTAYSNIGRNFFDITKGSNGVYSAGFGYDFCTGLGSPDIGNILTIAQSRR